MSFILEKKNANGFKPLTRSTAFKIWHKVFVKNISHIALRHLSRASQQRQSTIREAKRRWIHSKDHKVVPFENEDPILIFQNVLNILENE